MSIADVGSPYSYTIIAAPADAGPLAEPFEPALRCALLDFVTVYSKEDVRFTLPSYVHLPPALSCGDVHVLFLSGSHPYA